MCQKSEVRIAPFGTPKNGAGAWSWVRQVVNKHLLLVLILSCILHCIIERNCSTGVITNRCKKHTGVKANRCKMQIAVITNSCNRHIGVKTNRRNWHIDVIVNPLTTTPLNSPTTTVAYQLCTKLNTHVALSIILVFPKYLSSLTLPPVCKRNPIENKFKTKYKKPGLNGSVTYVGRSWRNVLTNLGRH